MSIETKPIEENEAKTLVGTSEGRNEVMQRLEFDLARVAARLRGMAQAHLVLGCDLVAGELLNTVESIERVYPLLLMIYCATLQEHNEHAQKMNDNLLSALLQGASPEMASFITSHVKGK